MNALASTPKCGVLVIGSEPPPPETVAAAETCDEVFIVARAVASDGGWLVDETRAYSDARDRLERLRRQLSSRGVAVRGIVGDANAAAARKDAEAIFPRGVLLS
jgi:hypothetical protein